MQNETLPMTNKNETVTGRFAPSPSGRLHLGNLACSLLAWLSAKSRGGRIVLRIEDLDAERCPRIYADLLEQDLDWLGLGWDEGGSTGGPHGPYYQSECAEIYTEQYQKLDAICYCLGTASVHSFDFFRNSSHRTFSSHDICINITLRIKLIMAVHPVIKLNHIQVHFPEKFLILFFLFIFLRKTAKKSISWSFCPAIHNIKCRVTAP